jgi:hypothetical protein
MPIRPDTHVVEDIALSAVIQICNRHGWATEVVHKDYGDDVLVQPKLGDRIDQNRIWIQVKGTRDIQSFHSKRHGYSRRVSLDHALKWIRSADLTLVVLWDVEKNYGLWTIPKKQVNQWDLLSLENKKARLIFDETSRFCSEQMDKIGWIARVDHYTNLLAIALMDDREIVDSSGDLDILVTESSILLIAVDFLATTGIMDGDGISKLFRELYENTIVSIRNLDKDMPENELREMALTVSILKKIDALVESSGVSGVLVEICFKIILLLYGSEGWINPGEI